MDAEGTDRLGELRAAARGWHGVQLAVLGFIGLCGVLQGSGGDGNPRWLQILAGLLVLLALALACIATGLVASAAWPLDALSRGTPDEQAIGRIRRRLRTGITITYVAVAVLAIAATSSWWPGEAAALGLVEVTTGSGVLCGELREADAGAIAVEVAGRQIVLSLGDVLGVRPVEACA